MDVGEPFSSDLAQRPGLPPGARLTALVLHQRELAAPRTRHEGLEVDDDIDRAPSTRISLVFVQQMES